MPSQSEVFDMLINEAKEKGKEEGEIKAVIEMIEIGATDFEKVKAAGCFSERVLQEVEASMQHSKL
jgi:hypothetical protein